jgi:hypothetical protein
MASIASWGLALTDLVYDLLDNFDVRRTISTLAVEAATASDTARRKNKVVHPIVLARRYPEYTDYVCVSD